MREFTMTHVPHWIGGIGFVLQLILLGAFLAGSPFVALGLTAVCFGLVIIENRYEQHLTT
jgi:hypothetical protein